MWSVLKIIGFLALCYAAITVWVYMSQRRMLYNPRYSVDVTPADAGLAYEDVWLTNDLGTRIHGWWLPHENARFTLLFCHGNGGNISHRLESLRIFHNLGLSVLIYDYSGYGKSDGEPSEEATRSDTRAAWAWLMERGIKPESVVLFGRSLGGGVAAHQAATLYVQGVSPAGVMLESTFTSVPDMGAHIYPWLPVRMLSKYQYDTKGDISGLSLPILFLHSPDDDIVPYAIGMRLQESYRGPKTVVELVGDHNTGFIETGPRYVEALDAYLTSLERRGE